MKIIKKIANVLLAIILLVAVTGVTLHKHYCMGRLKSVAINKVANPCDGEGTTGPMPCCEDVSQKLKVEEIIQATFDFDAQPDLFRLAIISYVLPGSTPIVKNDRPQFQYYSPPLPEIDYQVEHQVFLI